MNISLYSNEQTAKTCIECAYQRAENLSILGSKVLLETCIGPSLRTLEHCYSKFNIETWGNDIESRWKKYYPEGKWIIGDCTKLDLSMFDTVVIAPPLSKGCSGRREDSLNLESIVPSYYNFLHLKNKIIVFVLPGRTLSVKQDRMMLYKFLSHLEGHFDLVPLKNKVIKYLDIYWRPST